MEAALNIQGGLISKAVAAFFFFFFFFFVVVVVVAKLYICAGCGERVNRKLHSLSQMSLLFFSALNLFTSCSTFYRAACHVHSSHCSSSHCCSSHSSCLCSSYFILQF